MSDDPRVRLQKALAAAGVASRRACEVLIAKGRVAVNGTVVTEQGTRINPAEDRVEVDGVVVQLDPAKRYFVLNKPRGIVSTMADEQGRPDLTRYTSQVSERIYNVGRLDTDTSGLLILTNDGELAHALAHPSFEVPKTYVAKVRGVVASSTLTTLRRGITLDDGPIRADAAKILSSTHHSSLVELTLHSGKNRIVRRMLDAVGHPVIELVRRQFGPLHLGALPVGQMRELSDAERGALLTVAQDPSSGTKRVSGGRPGDGKGARGMRGVARKGAPAVRSHTSPKNRRKKST